MMQVNVYRTFELAVRAHVYIDYSADGWPPVCVHASEAPSQESQPHRSLRVRLRDNGGSEQPSREEMRRFTRGMRGAKIVERDTGRAWLAISVGWNTKPHDGAWPPPEDHESPPASDEFSLSVLPWRDGFDHVVHECDDGCGAKLVVWRDSHGVERRVHEGFETPAREEDRWIKVDGGYLHEWCRTGWRQVCDARSRWRKSIGKPDEAERIAELRQAEIEHERRSRS